MAPHPTDEQEAARFSQNWALLDKDNIHVPKDVRERARVDALAYLESMHESSNVLETYNVLWRNNERTCPRCEEEEGVSSEDKAC